MSLEFSNAFTQEYQGPSVDSPVICLPLKDGGSKWANNELRFCLRAFAQFWAPERPRPIVELLTGTPPSWINRDMVRVHSAPEYVQAIIKAMQLAEEHSPSKHYIWWNDDIFLLKPTTEDDLKVGRQILGPMSPMSGLRGNGWRKKLCRVRDTVHQYGLAPVYNFSSHTPYLFHAPAMQRVIACIGVQYKTPLETAYFNMMRQWYPRRKCHDKLVFYRDKPFPADLEPYRFLSVSDNGLSSRVKGFLQGRFPTKSCYEA